MRTLAVIPARLGATRLPRKPLRLLAGIPLVVRVWQRVKDTGVAHQCVVATDSDEVVRALTPHGVPVVITSSQHPSGTDRVAEVARHADFASFDVILNVQGDEPFVSERALAETTELVTTGAFELATAAARAGTDILENPNVVKVVAADDGRAMYFSRAAIPFLRDGEDAPIRAQRVWQHIGVYAYSRSALDRWVMLPVHPLERVERLEQLRPLAAGMAIGVAVVDEPVLPGIDTEEDLARANREWIEYTPG
jgi:3-deoxy-manno-octulosonate cytidylyltransferase (CMP-KDO synthetase)